MVCAVRVSKGKINEEEFVSGDALMVEYRDDIQDGKATRYVEVTDGEK